MPFSSVTGRYVYESGDFIRFAGVIGDNNLRFGEVENYTDFPGKLASEQEIHPQSPDEGWAGHFIIDEVLHNSPENKSTQILFHSYYDSKTDTTHSINIQTNNWRHFGGEWHYWQDVPAGSNSNEIWSYDTWLNIKENLSIGGPSVGGLKDGHQFNLKEELEFENFFELPNNAPILSGTPAILANGTEDVAYTINASDLLQGYTDVDGDTLSVTSLKSSVGSLTNNGNAGFSSWTINTPQDFNGKIDLSYSVIDGNGGSANATQSFSLAEANYAPIESNGSIELLKDQNGMGWVKYPNGTLDDITEAGRQRGNESWSGEWSLASAEIINGINKVIWIRNDGVMAEWSTDSSWNHLTGPTYNQGSDHYYRVEAEFQTDFNGDGITGFDADKDGIVDGTRKSGYYIFTGDKPIKLTDARGDHVSDITGSSFDVAKVISTESSYKALLTGQQQQAGNYYVWNVSSSGQAANEYGWANGQQMSNEGYEAEFNIDFNGDGAINSPPILSGTPTIFSNGTEDVAYSINASDLLQGYSDVDGDVLSVSGLTTSVGSLTNNGNGSWTLNTPKDFNGTVDLSYSVIDGNGGASNASTSLTFDAVNDLPPGVSVSGDDVITGENGDTAVFQFQLNTEPVEPVTINFSLSDTSEASLSAASITFNSTNWNTAQAITVTGLEDSDISSVSYDLRASISTSDLVYKDITIDTINLINKDNGLHKSKDLVGTNDVDYLDGAKGNDQIYGLLRSDRLRGFEGNDSLYGGSHDDQLLGGDGDDELYGESGNDTLTGGAGNDLIDGGSYGTDIAIFSGNLSDYRFTEANGRVTAEDLRNGSTDGTDTLVDIEQVQFADQEVSIAEALQKTGVFTTVESKGSVELQKDANGMGWVKLANGTTDDITAGGQRKGDGSYQGWSQVAAETISGQNKVIWTHSDGRMSEWNLDSNWNHTGSTIHAAGSTAFSAVESSFNMDFNNDSVVGSSNTTIESKGSVELQKDANGMGWVKLANGTTDDITAGGQRKGDGSYQGWSQVAAETISGQNKVIWTHSDGRMSEWNLDSNWNHTGTTIHAPGSTAFSAVESSFNMDFNNDSVVGSSNTTIESKGSVELQKDANGMGWVKLANGTTDDITAGGQRKGDGSYQGWSQVAAETISGQNKVIWTHSDGRMSEWNLDSNWNYTGTTIHAPGSTAFSAVESSFNMDFNNDSVVGSSNTTIESKGSVELQKDANGMGWVKLANGTTDDITAGGQRKGDGSYQGWSQVAAETISGQNKVIWTHSDGRMSEWNLDSNWNYTGSTIHAAGSTAFSAVESSFNMDFNNDSVVGSSNTTIESKGSVELQKDANGMGWVKLANGTTDDITAGGQRKGDGSYQGWSQVAAETISGQNKVIWTHSDGRMSEWNLDSNWNYTGSTIHAAGSTAFSAVESSFNMDFNNDSVVGVDPLA